MPENIHVLRFIFIFVIYLIHMMLLLVLSCLAETETLKLFVVYFSTSIIVSTKLMIFYLASCCSHETFIHARNWYAIFHMKANKSLDFQRGIEITSDGSHVLHHNMPSLSSSPSLCLSSATPPPLSTTGV